jgi:hypothetical protein
MTSHEPLYVVTVQHSTGHGPMVSVALVTHSRPAAVNCARNVKTMAYEFNTDDGATVSQMVSEVVYDHMPGDRTRAHGNPTNQDSQFFWVTKTREGTWREATL